MFETRRKDGRQLELCFECACMCAPQRTSRTLIKLSVRFLKIVMLLLVSLPKNFDTQFCVSKRGTGDIPQNLILIVRAPTFPGS